MDVFQFHFFESEAPLTPTSFAQKLNNLEIEDINYDSGVIRKFLTAFYSQEELLKMLHTKGHPYRRGFKFYYKDILVSRREVFLARFPEMLKEKTIVQIKRYFENIPVDFFIENKALGDLRDLQQEGMTDEESKKIKKALWEILVGINTIPQPFLQKLYSRLSEFHIRKKVEGEASSKGAGAYYHSPYKEIVTFSNIPQVRASTTVHELGHALDHSLSHDIRTRFYNISWATNPLTFLGNKWDQVDSDESFITDYAHTNEREDFAESFTFYITNKNVLKEKSPLKYQFFKDLEGCLEARQNLLKDCMGINTDPFEYF
jgi:hypothetical protein